MRIAVPRAECEATALNVLRLDPLRRHGEHFGGGLYSGGDSTLSNVSDFRALWKVLEDAAKLAPAEVTELFPLPASKAEFDRRKKAAEESGQGGSFAEMGSFLPDMGRERAMPRTPGAMLLQHQFVRGIAQLLER